MISNMFAKLKLYLNDHLVAVILSFLLAITVFYPVLSFPFIAGKEYKGIDLPPFNDATYYISRAREVLDGNGLGNALMRGNKDVQDVNFTQAERILFYPFALLGVGKNINVVTLFFIYGFAGVFALILLIYFFVLKLTSDKLVSIVAGIFVIGGYQIIYNKTLFYTDFNIYCRPIFPLMSSLVFFLYLNFLIRALDAKRKLYYILSALFFGLAFHVSVYAWTFFLSFNFVIAVLYFIKKDFYRIKKLILVFVGGILLGLPNLLNMYFFLSSDGGKELSLDRGLQDSHAFVFSKIGFATLFLFGIFIYLRREKRYKIFVLSLILAGWVALNQQIVTGKVVQIGHYYWYFVVPVSIVCGFYMIWHIFPRKSIRNILFSFVIFLAFLNTIVGQYRSSLTLQETNLYIQRFAPALSYFKNIKENAVILAEGSSNFEQFLFTIYTHHDLFWGDTADRVSLERRKDAFYLYSYLKLPARQDFTEYLLQSMDQGTDNSYTGLYTRYIEEPLSGYDRYKYNHLAAIKDPVMMNRRKEILEVLSKEYGELVSDPKNVIDLLEKYDVKYIVLDKNKHPEWDLSFLKEFQEVQENQGIYIYKKTE